MSGSATSVGGEESLSSIALVNVALRHIRLLVLVPLVTVVIAGAVAMLGGETYTAESTFRPQTPNIQAGGLAGLAAQFGMNVGSLGEGESVDYFARLIESREILTDVVRSEYAVAGGDGEARRADLLTHYGIEGSTEGRRLWAAIARLRGEISTTVDHGAGVITVVTKAPTGDLAEQINARILAALAEFNLEKRQSRARAEREFVEAQAAAAESELRDAEARLAEFLAQNRRYQNSPEMVNEAERLRRQVELREMLYSGLARSLAEARLDEVRNTPVLTLLDRPEGSAREERGLRLALVMGFLLGLALAGLWVFVAEYAARQRTLHPGDFRELEVRVGALKRRLLPWGHHGRTLAGGARRPAVEAGQPAPAVEEPTTAEVR
ncbi:MAG TPA: hypothetical protein VMM12_10200 [Longimicrobiales bacterium]|nr:hypothetical protein [Longimicrobiales bacterium]